MGLWHGLGIASDLSRGRKENWRHPVRGDNASDTSARTHERSGGACSAPVPCDLTRRALSAVLVTVNGPP